MTAACHPVPSSEAPASQHQSRIRVWQRSVIAWFALLVCTLAPALVHAGEEDHITPYRPTVSNSAQLPTPGQLELELGVLSARNDLNRTSVPYLFKLAFNQEWGVLIGGEVLVAQYADDGSRLRGVGNTTITAKRAFVRSEASALGLEFTASLPTAKTAIGGGKVDLTVNGIVSQDIGSVHLDANLNLTRVGAIDDDTGRLQTGLSAALSTPLSTRWSLATELAGTRRDGVALATQALVALAFSPTKRLTLDFGVIKGLRAASHDWSVFGGVVIPVAHLW